MTNIGYILTTKELVEFTRLYFDVGTEFGENILGARGKMLSFIGLTNEFVHGIQMRF